jgi:hypothetical protein
MTSPVTLCHPDAGKPKAPAIPYYIGRNLSVFYRFLSNCSPGGRFSPAAATAGIPRQAERQAT